MEILSPTLIYLVMSVIMVPLFQKLGLGSVLGYLTAGVLVGPHVFKLIPDPQNVISFAELGVVFLLFIIGLELQPKRLWSMRKHLIGIGGLQVLICTIGLGLICSLFSFTITQSLVIGFILSLSSTAFALQTLMEKKQLHTEYGRTSFAILLMQDIVAIPALAIIPLFGLAKLDSQMSQWTILWLVLTVLVLFLISRFLIRPLFRLIASTKNRESFTAITLLIVLGVSAWMHHLGLSMGLGAFLAGVLLADSEYRHELETDLEPFKGLLMGLFFIAVGMSVNLSLLWQSPLFIIGMTFAYKIAKGSLIYLVARIAKLKSEPAKNTAFYLAQGGEFAFVLFASASQGMILEQSVVETLTLIVTFSMVLSPLALMFNEKVLQPHYNRCNAIQNPKKEFDVVHETENPVMIAGYGRVGQIVARTLRSQGIGFTALEIDTEQIELIRRFGNTVYYGDASRVDLLEKAGAGNAKLFILAIDDVDSSVATAKAVRENFPNLKILARARNRQHAFELKDLGIDFIKRETFDSSVDLSKEMLIELGYERDRADRLMQKFKLHDESMLLEQHRVRHDEKQMVSVSRQSIEQLAQVMRDDITL